MSILRAIRCDVCKREFSFRGTRTAHDVRGLLKAAGWYVGCSGPTGHARYQTGRFDYCPCVRAKKGPIALPVPEPVAGKP